MGKIENDRATQPLINMHEDKSENLRWHVVRSLKEITGELYGMDITKLEQMIDEQE